MSNKLEIDKLLIERMDIEDRLTELKSELERNLANGRILRSHIQRKQFHLDVTDAKLKQMRESDV